MGGQQEKKIVIWGSKKEGGKIGIEGINVNLRAHFWRQGGTKEKVTQCLQGHSTTKRPKAGISKTEPGR